MSLSVDGEKRCENFSVDGNRKRVLMKQCERGVINAMSTVYARVGVGNFFLHLPGEGEN